MPDYPVKADVDTMLRANDKAGIRSAIGVGQTDAPTFLAQTLTGQSLTGTQATSLVDLSATWDTTGTPSLIYARVATTNANNAAKLLDLGTLSQGQVFSVNRYGGVASADSVSVASGSHMSGTTVGVGPAGRFGFSSNTGNSSGFVFSTGLYQDAPGILAQRNGTASQALRVYNTYGGTGGVDYERGFIRYATGFLEIGYEFGGLGGTRDVQVTGPNHIFLNSGAAGAVGFKTAGVLRAYFDNFGKFRFYSDNAYDIGLSSTDRPRNIYVGTGIYGQSLVMNSGGSAFGPTGSSSTWLTLGAANTSASSLRITSGVAPTSPVNGDIWFDGTDVKICVGGVTKTFTLI